MSISETETDEDQGLVSPQEAPDQSDEKELLLQRRLARIEEALGLSPLT